MAGEFAKLLEGNEDIPKIVRGFHRAIEGSFRSERTSVQTDTEVRRRFDICARIYRQLRGDLKWSVSRIMDHLPKYLRCELDGEAWKPDDRQAWIPD